MNERRYRVFGFLRAELGLGQAGRITLDALQASGRFAEAHDVGPFRRLPLRLLFPAVHDDSPDTRPRVNVFHLNPIDMWKCTSSWGASTGPTDLNVCVPFWELPNLPRRWVRWLGAADCVLAATEFIEQACRDALPNTPILRYPLAKCLPPTPSRRAAFGISPDRTVFLITFDWLSDPERKNPLLGVRAFREAFPTEDDVELILKVTNLPKDAAEPTRAALMSHVSQDRRIKLISETLPRGDLFALFASVDAVISLHRAEGLGLHLMEAMSLGKSVIATAFSGNLDFMDDGCSWLVSYDLVPTRSRHPFFAEAAAERSQVWAEANLGAAVRALREVRAYPALRHERGERARLRVEERARLCRSGLVFDRLEAEVAPKGDSTRRFFRLAQKDFLHCASQGAVGRLRRRWASSNAGFQRLRLS